MAQNEQAAEAEVIEVEVVDEPTPQRSEERGQTANLPALANDSPMAMMIHAKQAGFTTDEIRDMMDLQDRHDAREAKKAFDQAMSEWKRNPPKVIHDRINDQYGSGYSSLGNLVNTVNESMGPFGLNAHWDFPAQSPESKEIVCTCILRHKQGHEESVTLSAPIDTSGAKNPIQQRRSTRTYLRVETFEAVTGIATMANVDDDGNGAGGPERIDEEHQTRIHAKITDNDLNMDQFLDWLKKTHRVGSIDRIPVALYDTVDRFIDSVIKARSKS